MKLRHFDDFVEIVKYFDVNDMVNHLFGLYI